MTATGQLEIDLAGQTVVLRSDRALFLPAERALFVADLHVGKSESLRAAGAPIPVGVLDETLARLARAAMETASRQIVVLGDLIHAPSGLTDTVRARVAAWREAVDAQITLVLGNHDRKLRSADINSICGDWQIDIADDHARVGPFVLQHEPEPRRDAHALAGHLHPAAVLGSRRDRVKVPAFWSDGGTGPGGVTVLPAFGMFASGVGVKTRPGDGLWGITPERVMTVQDPADVGSRVRLRPSLSRSPAR
jgi:DNA ligase-associated metallophosphoesterase